MDPSGDPKVFNEQKLGPERRSDVETLLVLPLLVLLLARRCWAATATLASACPCRRTASNYIPILYMRALACSS